MKIMYIIIQIIISYLKENDYYKNSIANTIMIRFISSDEVTETLKTFGVKLYKSKFYFFYPYRDQLPERDDVKTVSIQLIQEEMLQLQLLTQLKMKFQQKISMIHILLRHVMYLKNIFNIQLQTLKKLTLL